MNAELPTSRQLFTFRTIGPAAGSAAVLGPFATFYAMVLLPPPWNWCALLPCLLCAGLGVVALRTGHKWHRRSIIIVGLVAVLSAVVQLLLFVGLAVLLTGAQD